MILILTGDGDLTTLSVIQWLRKMERQVFVISGDDHINDITIENQATILSFAGNRKLNLTKVTAYWYRRGSLSIATRAVEHEAITRHLKTENNTVLEFITELLGRIPHLSGGNERNLNRLVIMDISARIGFTVPPFGIYTKRKDAVRFFYQHKKIVTKPLSNSLNLIEDGYIYNQYTVLFTKEDVQNLPDRFAPALFAAYIEKKYELRIFYLNGQCYAMAILSQLDKQTSVDMRTYNYQKPNRGLPYKLPPFIEEKINRLMKELQLKTGSVDMIVTPDDTFVFLEVNPVGQFGNVSALCNYRLEEKVAGYLNQISA